MGHEGRQKPPDEKGSRCITSASVGDKFVSSVSAYSKGIKDGFLVFGPTLIIDDFPFRMPRQGTDKTVEFRSSSFTRGLGVRVEYQHLHRGNLYRDASEIGV